MSKFRTQRFGMQKPGSGMSRFFSPANLDRYRKLASGAIGEAEQHELLQDLVEEMNAFRREARVAAVNRRSAFMASVSSHTAGQISTHDTEMRATKMKGKPSNDRRSS